MIGYPMKNRDVRISYLLLNGNVDLNEIKDPVRMEIRIGNDLMLI